MGYFSVVDQDTKQLSRRPTATRQLLQLFFIQSRRQTKMRMTAFVDNIYNSALIKTLLVKSF